MRWRPLAAAVLVLVLVAAVALVASSVLRHRSGPAAIPGGAPSWPSSATPSVTPPPTTSPAAPPGGPSATPSAPGCVVPRRLSVLTFNIHGGRTRHGVDLPAVAREIRAARADVVLLQEVDQDLERTGFRDEPHVLAHELGMRVYYRAPVRSNAILTRLPVTAWSSTRLPLWPGREERRLVHATVLVAGQAVEVFTTHLDQSFGKLRQLQIRAAERLMAPYADEPLILGGDLNSTPDSAVLAALRARLRDSWREAGTGSGDTVPARHPRRRIDYVLHDSWLSVRTARVRPSRASDHRSLRVAFDLWGRRGCAAEPPGDAKNPGGVSGHHRGSREH